MGEKWDNAKDALKTQMDSKLFWRSWKWKLSYRTTKLITRAYFKLELIAALTLVVGSVYLAKEFVEWYMKKQLLRYKREVKQAQREQAVEAMAARCVQKMLSDDRQQEILDTSVKELIDKLKDGSVTPEEVLVAYQKKTLEVHEKYNVITEVLKEVEEQLEGLSGQDTKSGILYGLPVTLKDHYSVKDYDSCCGTSCLIGEAAGEDCVLVKVLKKQGALPFVKTNTSQLLAAYDCNNPVFGETSHPADFSRTPGGSSGGCAALVSAGGSPLSFGSDIGGSIRHPCSNCGLCGLKPTQGRISTKGLTLLPEGFPLIDDCLGPIARDVDTVNLAMQALVCDYMFELDSSLPPVPWNNEVISETRKLTIGYYEWDETVIPTLACRRAVHEAKQALEKQGHTLIPWCPPEMSRVTLDLAFSTFELDGGREFIRYLYGDEISPAVQLQATVFSLPWFIRKIMSYIMRPFDAFIGQSLDSTCGIWFTSSYVKLQEQFKAYKAQVTEEWKNLKLDAVIGPVFPVPAMPKHVLSTYFGVSYLMVYNILQFPAGVVPVSTVTADDVVAMDNYPGNKQTASFYKDAKEGMKGAEGLPLCVQVATLPWADEMCVKVMKEIESRIKVVSKDET